MKKKTRLQKYFFVLVLVAGFLWVCPSGAQDYPKGTIQVVVPFAPGGSTDIFWRTLAEYLSKNLNANVAVINKAGAGGVVGVSSVVNSKPDGYTLAAGSVSSAQSAFSASCGWGYYAMTLEDLSLAPPGGNPFIWPDLASTGVIKSAYTVTMASDAPAPGGVPAACNLAALGGGYHATAIPLPGGGTREFGTNTDGTIYFTVIPAAIAITDRIVPSGTPLHVDCSPAAGHLRSKSPLDVHGRSRYYWLSWPVHA